MMKSKQLFEALEGLRERKKELGRQYASMLLSKTVSRTELDKIKTEQSLTDSKLILTLWEFQNALQKDWLDLIMQDFKPLIKELEPEKPIRWKRGFTTGLAPWICSYCGKTGNTLSVCSNCGKPKP
jgi:hypothetical protein